MSDLSDLAHRLRSAYIQEIESKSMIQHNECYKRRIELEKMMEGVLEEAKKKVVVGDKKWFWE